MIYRPIPGMTTAQADMFDFCMTLLAFPVAGLLLAAAAALIALIVGGGVL